MPTLQKDCYENTGSLFGGPELLHKLKCDNEKECLQDKKKESLSFIK